MHRSPLPVCAALSAALLAVLALPAAAQQPNLSAAELHAALRTGNPDAALAERLRRWFGPDRIKDFPPPRTSDLTVAWAVEVPGGKPVTVVADEGGFRLPLQRVGATGVYAGTANLPEATGMRWHYDVGGERKGGGVVEVYTTPSELKKQPGVPEGKLTQMPQWRSQVFPDTVRDWWVYVPAQYDGKTPACVMVFQDGGGAKNWVPTAFDNLIAKGDMPVTVGVFVNPGRKLDQKPEEQRPRNRSFEYDTLSDRYSRFLLEEILPEVEKTVKLRRDPAGRAICGESSGGICAFTVAWERPDQFHKVVSHIGSFVNLAAGESGIAGGHNYPPMIRRTKDKPKPIRAFLQDGANDLDNPFGNWPLANQEMAAALKWAGYDHKFVYGQGAHNGSHGRAIFPDTMRWLWRDWRETPPPPAAAQ